MESLMVSLIVVGFVAAWWFFLHRISGGRVVESAVDGVQRDRGGDSFHRGWQRWIHAQQTRPIRRWHAPGRTT